MRVDATEAERRATDGGRELRRPGSVSLVEDTVGLERPGRADRPRGHAVEPLLIDDFAVEPADDPVIGPELSRPPAPGSA